MNIEEIKTAITEANQAAFVTVNETIESLKTNVTENEKKFNEKIETLTNSLPQEKRIVVGDEPIDKDINDGFESFYDFAYRIYDEGKAGAEDGKLKTWRRKAAGTGLSENVESDGGTLIPTQFRTQLLRNSMEQADLVRRCLPIPMKTNSIVVPYLKDTDRSSGYTHGLVQMYWTKELGQRSESRPKTGGVNLVLNKVVGMCYVSDELLEDSPISLGPLIDTVFSEALAYTLDYCVLNGTGAGQPLGIRNAPCTVEVSKVTNQAAATIAYANICDMYARMPNAARKKAVWICNNDTLPQLMQMGIAVGSGGSAVFLPAGGASGQPYNTIFGKEVVFTELAQTLGTNGDIMFCSFPSYLIGKKEGKKGNIQSDMSIHLKFDYDQIAYKYTLRIDGQPWWPAPLTPRHSSSTLSPFVKLATRS